MNVLLRRLTRKQGFIAIGFLAPSVIGFAVFYLIPFVIGTALIGTVHSMLGCMLLGPSGSTG